MSCLNMYKQWRQMNKSCKKLNMCSSYMMLYCRQGPSYSAVSLLNIQILCAVQNSEISLAEINTRFSCINDFVPPFPTFYEL